MTIQEDQNNGLELVQTLIQKAWESETFKSQLVNNPESAIVSVTGKPMTIPEGKKIVVIDQTDENVVYINIPAKPNVSDFELTEEELEAVSGGSTDYTGWNPIIWIGIGAHELYNMVK